MRNHLLSLSVGLGLCCAGSPAGAETMEARFSVRLIGVPVGEMVVAQTAAGGAYAASGLFRTTGLAGLLARVRFTMSARGVGAVPDLASRSYSEDLDTGYRTSTTAVRFAAGDARIDPLSAMVAIVGDRPADAGCTLARKTWDGTRAMQVVMREASRTGAGGFTCTGTITRLSGYDAQALARGGGVFPFTVEFAAAGDRAIAVSAGVRTEHGQVALVRD